ncbi:5'-3' exonuclease [Carbonactinospora thermoautotrophica]|uniref:5'-3' exonuclease n=1 Tax=Carbonactinospora thermoautotrophica TaxID=1469144 RepID=A0A132MIX6_9ACTN|nr:5'-3' exonuclease H3TH domain-containing protein [Carbonactinospora thermoautotrophica]KWW97743.1 5'-3' exonuclease [Carbonactinospora thermoautotrophica]KWX07236.1 5'-3' exonuclease [Carbonactinospora thermoautotrophica]
MGPGGPAPLLLVDGHHLLWAGTFGFPVPVWSRDKTRELTGVFAFFALLRATIRDDLDTGPPEVLVVFDGEHGGADRKVADPRYKAHRPTDPAALTPLQALPEVKRGLDAYGIAWVEVDDAEADDVIATLTYRYADRPVRIMSGDQDYYQLLDEPRVRVVNRARRTGQRLITAAEVAERFGVTPAQWVDYRALTGDASDGLAGVRGVGKTTAARLLAGGLTLEDLPGSGRLAGATGRAVAAAWPRVLTWRAMIRMRTDVPVPSVVRGAPSPALPAPAEVLDKLELW